MKHRLLTCLLLFSLCGLKGIKAQEVNPLTGNFNYSIPAISIPGPNGESVTLSLGYNSDIKMDQDASWIGLGWGLNVGEISRHIQGVPDDYKNQTNTDIVIRAVGDFPETNESVMTHPTSWYGPMHFGAFPYPASSDDVDFNVAMDVYQSSKDIESSGAYFQAANFDQYNVTAPGISGSLYPYMDTSISEEEDALNGVLRLKLGDIVLGVELTKEGINVSDVFGRDVVIGESFFPEGSTIMAGNIIGGGSDTYASNIQHSDIEEAFGITLADGVDWYIVPSGDYPEGIWIEGLLYHEGDTVKVGDPIARSYPLYDSGADEGGKYKRLITKSIPDYDDYDVNTKVFFTHTDVSDGYLASPFIGSSPIVGIPVNQKYDSTHEMVFEYKNLNGNRVEYFSNESIINNDVSDFIESSQLSTRVGLPLDGIGAYRITDTRGMKYHFSLPVYTLSQESVSMKFSGEGDVIKELKKNIQNNAYARSWKLTAITGLNYVDTNSDGLVNDGDTGYWVAYDYEKENNLDWQQPRYGFYSNRSFVENYKDVLSRNVKSGFDRNGSFSFGTSERYHITTVETATHKLFAQTGDRNDLFDKNGNVYGKSLKGLYLIDKRTLYNTNLSLPQNPLSVSDFETLKSKSLSSVLLTQDDDLCKGVENLTGTSDVFSLDENGVNTFLYKEANYASSLSQDGKLTLNKLTFYQKDGIQMSAPYEFDYHSSLPDENPNYNFKRKDYWGYYNPDLPIDPAPFDSRYALGNSNHIGAWALKEVELPTGGHIEIEYENKAYTAIIDSYNGFMEKSFAITESMIDLDTDANGVTTLTLNFDEVMPASILNNLGVDCTRIGFKLTGSPVVNLGEEYFIHIPTDSWYHNRVDGSSNGTFSVVNGSNKKIEIELDNAPTASGFKEGILSFRYTHVVTGASRVKKIHVTDLGNGTGEHTEYVYDSQLATLEPTPINNIIHGHYMNKNFVSDRHSMGPQIIHPIVTVKKTNATGTETLGSKKSFYRLPYPHYTKVSKSKTHNMTHVFHEDYTNMFGLVSKEITMNGSGKEQSIVDYTYNEFGSRTSKYKNRGSGLMATNRNQYYIQTLRREHLSMITTTQDGLSSQIEFTNHDEKTGKPTVTLSKEPSGKESSLVSKPAYQIFLEGGISVLEMNNRLDEHGLDELYEMNNVAYQDDITGATQDKLVGGNKTLYKKDFDQITNINGTYAAGTELNYYLPYASAVYNGSADYTNWEPGNTVTLIGKNHMPLETIASSYADGGYSASKYDVDEHYKIAEASNCNYASFSASSFEKLKSNFFDGHLKNNNASIETNRVHSGTQSIRVVPGALGVYYQSRVWEEEEFFAGETFVYHKGLIPGKRYRASVWVHKDSPDDAKLEIELQGHVLTQSENDPSIFSFSSLSLDPNTGTYAFSLSHGVENINEDDVKIIANSIKNLHISKTDDMTAQEVSDVATMSTQQSDSPWVQNNEVIEFVGADMTVASFAVAGDPLDGDNSYNCDYNFTKNVEKSDYVVDAGDWKLIMIEFDVPEGFRDANACLPYESKGLVCKLVGGTANNPMGASDSYFDDFRLQPVDANVSAYVYDLRTGLVTEVLNNNNMMTRFVYDSAGRQREVYQEKKGGLKKIQAIDYETAK